MTNDLIKQALGVGESKNAMDEEYMLKPAYHYFIEPITQLAFEQSENIEAYGPGFKERIAAFLLQTGSDEVVNRLFDANMISKFGIFQHINCIKWLRQPSRDTKAKAAVAIAFMTSMREQYVDDDSKYIKEVIPMLQHIVKQREFRESGELSKDLLRIDYKPMGEQDEEKRAKLLETSESILTAIKHIYSGQQEGTEMMAPPHLKTLSAIQTADLSTMEAEIRVAPSEEVKGWIADLRTEVEQGTGPKRKKKKPAEPKPEWKYNLNSSDSEDSAVFNPDDDEENKTAAAKPDDHSDSDSGKSSDSSKGKKKKKDKKQKKEDSDDSED